MKLLLPSRFRAFLQPLDHANGAPNGLDVCWYADPEEDDPDLLWAHAQLALREWRLEAAEALLERLVAAEPSAVTLERHSLCADLRGDFAEADRRLERAQAADPTFTLPARLTPEEFERIVEEAVEQLPREFRAPLETTEIVVEPVPLAWMIDASEPADTPPDLLGLFVGTSQLEQSEVAGNLLPRRIYLFQRNLERSARSREELLSEIRVTLFHELGHVLGFDEEGVEAMGLE